MAEQAVNVRSVTTDAPEVIVVEPDLSWRLAEAVQLGRLNGDLQAVRRAETLRALPAGAPPPTRPSCSARGAWTTCSRRWSHRPTSS